MKKLVFLIVMLYTLMGCRPTYNKKINFTSNEWKRMETVKFQVVMENPGKYDVFVRIYYNDEMQGNYFAMSLMMYAPTGEERYLEQNEKLFVEGQATGEQNEEGYYEFTMEFFKELDLSREGFYEFVARNRMPAYKVKGIQRIELVLKPV
ncbi:MAG: hypothetical protein K9H84_00145 [Bacteroidales bacterium]|nr:hypothetical protein [Bacteroidales bacterium]